LLFGFGLVVMLKSPFDKSDTAQMILMGSPLLALVGLAAYRFMANLPAIDSTPQVDPAWSNMSTITTLAFLAALFTTYSMAAVDTNLTADILKFIVGSIETALGGYLGINRDTLFPDEALKK